MIEEISFEKDISGDKIKGCTLFLVIILLLSLLPHGATVDAKSIGGEGESVPYGVPSWNVGDSWTYKYHLNASSGTIEEMYQEGELTLTVEDEETKYIDDTSYKVYKVSYERVYEVEGETEDPTAGTVFFEMDGRTFGTHYYRKSDLEMVEADIKEYMEGISTPEIVDKEIKVNITAASNSKAVKPASFLNTPIELGDTWDREAVYDRYSDRYNSFIPSGDPYPENESIVKDYEVLHNQQIEASSEQEFEAGGETYEVLNLEGTDTWGWNGDADKEGSFTKRYSREVGNYVHISLEDMYDEGTGSNVSDKEMTLTDYEHDYQEIEDYGMNAYAEKNEICCQPGDEIKYRFTVENTGKNEDMIDFSIEKENDWDYSWSKENLELGPRSSATLNLTLEISPDTPENADYSFQVIFTSRGQPQNQHIVDLNTSLRTSFKPMITGATPPVAELKRLPGDKVSFSIEARSVDDSRLMTSWYVNGELISNGDNFELPLDEPGEYVVTAEVSNGEKKANSTWTVSVEQPSESYFMYYVALVIAAVISVVVGYIYYRRRKKKKKSDEADDDTQEGTDTQQSYSEGKEQAPQNESSLKEKQKPPPPKDQRKPPPPPGASKGK